MLTRLLNLIKKKPKNEWSFKKVPQFCLSESVETGVTLSLDIYLDGNLYTSKPVIVKHGSPEDYTFKGNSVLGVEIPEHLAVLYVEKQYEHNLYTLTPDEVVPVREGTNMEFNFRFLEQPKYLLSTNYKIV